MKFTYNSCYHSAFQNKKKLSYSTGHIQISQADEIQNLQITIVCKVIKHKGNDKVNSCNLELIEVEINKVTVL